MAPSRAWRWEFKCREGYLRLRESKIVMSVRVLQLIPMSVGGGITGVVEQIQFDLSAIVEVRAMRGFEMGGRGRGGWIFGLP